MRRGRFALLVAAALTVSVLPASAGSEQPAVAPGYDLFTTLSGTRIAVDLDGPGPKVRDVMSFASEPIGSFDFGDGPRDTGAADTVVRRLERATPSDGIVPIELVALQMRSVEPVGYYATLQDDRGRHPLDPPDALASPGVIDIRFDPGGAGGTFHVEFLVNYDIRHGSVDGPIVATGASRIQGDDRWQSSAPSQPQVACHSAGGPVPLHQHCVVSVAGDATTMTCGEEVAPIPAIPGVNALLNGEDDSADFHPGHATDSEECGTGGGQTCDLQSRSDGLTSPGTQSGVLKGTFVAGDPATPVGLGCAIQLNAPTHAGPDVTSRSASGTGSASVLGTVTYPMSPADTVYVCTQVTIGGGPVYYYDAASGEYSTSSAATCASSPTARPPGPGSVPGACNGVGSLTLSDGVVYPTVGPTVTASFQFSLACAGSGSLFGDGTLVGGCGQWSGSGQVHGAGPFSFEGVGMTWAFTGAVAGYLNLAPAPGESCTPPGPGADEFLVGGSLLH